MKARLIASTLSLVVTGALALQAQDATAPQSPGAGSPAPAFSLPDTHGATRSLEEFKGKIVVLEWTNPDCPFVKRHYGDGHMQTLQKKWVDKGVVWLSICSSAPGKQGHYPAEKWSEILAFNKAAATAMLLDPDGKTGRAYGARTTPHLFVIGADGVIVYAGAIDDKRSTDPADNATARNYVDAALEAHMAGKPVDPATTVPYGCSVKY